MFFLSMSDISVITELYNFAGTLQGRIFRPRDSHDDF